VHISRRNSAGMLQSEGFSGHWGVDAAISVDVEIWMVTGAAEEEVEGWVRLALDSELEKNCECRYYNSLRCTSARCSE
jgi:hypothetical protein